MCSTHFVKSCLSTVNMLQNSLTLSSFCKDRVSSANAFFYLCSWLKVIYRSEFSIDVLWSVSQMQIMVLWKLRLIWHWPTQLFATQKSHVAPPLLFWHSNLTNSMSQDSRFIDEDRFPGEKNTRDLLTI